MKIPSQLFQLVFVCVLIAQGFAISCSQCQSKPGKFSQDCHVGHMRTVKRCPASAQHCVTKTVIPSSGAVGKKQITVIRGCATTTRYSGCVNNPRTMTCTNICQKNACNSRPVKIPKRTSLTTLSSSSSSSSSSTSTISHTTTSTMTEELVSSTAASTQNCYQCSSLNGRNLECETSPNSTHIMSCPADEPYCTITITTSRVFKQALTVQRDCSSRIINGCMNHGNRFINTCVTTCTGDACNGGAVALRQSTPTTPSATTLSTTTQAPRRCYECSSNNGRNSDCENSPNSSHVTTCPPEKPFCTIKTTTSNFFTAVRTVQRECVDTLLNECFSHGNGVINTCFNSCTGDLCNSMQERLR